MSGLHQPELDNLARALAALLANWWRLRQPSDKQIRAPPAKKGRPHQLPPRFTSSQQLRDGDTERHQQ